MTLLWCPALLKPRSGMLPKDIEADFRQRAHDDVVGFKSLTVDGANVGQQMLHELGQSPTGMTKTVKSVRYDPREIAAEIRNKNAHAVLWNPQKNRYFLLPKCTWKPLRRFWVSRETQQECKHTRCRQRVLKRKVRASWCPRPKPAAPPQTKFSPWPQQIPARIFWHSRRNIFKFQSEFSGFLIGNI